VSHPGSSQVTLQRSLKTTTHNEKSTNTAGGDNGVKGKISMSKLSALYIEKMVNFRETFARQGKENVMMTRTRSWMLFKRNKCK
jgi:hypothetical protein